MDLVEWIELKTIPVIATELGVSEDTVKSWLYLKAAPQFDNAYKLKILSRGKLNFNSIYGPRFERVASEQKNT